MSTMKEVARIVDEFHVGKVVSAFRTDAVLEWDYGRVVEHLRSTTGGADELSGIVVKFFSDGKTNEYPLSILYLDSEDSFVVDVLKEDVIRYVWPVGTLVMAHLYEQVWETAHVVVHARDGLVMRTNRGSITFQWAHFMDDGRCADLKRLKIRRTRST